MTLAVHGDAYAAGAALDFAVNVWPAARPVGLERAMADALGETGYPDDAAARAAVAARHGRSVDEVLLANGACDVFWLLAHALRSRVAACVHPSFTEPERALRAAGSAVVNVPRRRSAGWRLDSAEVPEDATLVVLGNPNNPTGTLDPRDAILALVRPGRLVVVDEAFMDFVPGDAESVAALRQPGLAVVRSFTKLWSLAGVRAGYLVGPASLVRSLGEQRQPWSVNAIALAAMQWCARDEATPRAVGAEVALARARLVDGLRSQPAQSWPSAANFVLLCMPDAVRVTAALRTRGIAIRPAGSFPGLDDSFVRVAVRTPEANDILLAALADACR
jgi:histidinol-phosphate/aromatic aminotransferase/cobyric acid decarboxylase-like protein